MSKGAYVHKTTREDKKFMSGVKPYVVFAGGGYHSQHNTKSAAKKTAQRLRKYEGF